MQICKSFIDAIIIRRLQMWMGRPHCVSHTNHHVSCTAHPVGNTAYYDIRTMHDMNHQWLSANSSKTSVVFGQPSRSETFRKKSFQTNPACHCFIAKKPLFPMSESRSKISLVLQFSSLQISALEVISYFPPGYKAVKLKEN